MFGKYTYKRNAAQHVWFEMTSENSYLCRFVCYVCNEENAYLQKLCQKAPFLSMPRKRTFRALFFNIVKAHSAK